MYHCTAMSSSWAMATNLQQQTSSRNQIKCSTNKTDCHNLRSQSRVPATRFHKRQVQSVCGGDGSNSSSTGRNNSSNSISGSNTGQTDIKSIGSRAVLVPAGHASSVCHSFSASSTSSTVAEVSPQGPACDLAEAPRCTAMPSVDWSRYHLNILFVDRTDTVRARIASGFSERISEWNGFGRAILQSSCGVAAEEGTVPDPSTTAGLMAQAGLLGIRPQLFRPARECFELEDFCRYDVIVAMDEGIRQELLASAPVESGGDISWYSDRVCSVSTFRHYCGDEILAGGGSAVLEREFSGVLRAVLPAARAAVDIRRPSLLQVGPDEWNAMVVELLVACTGLFAYLRDQYPADLPEYDPQ